MIRKDVIMNDELKQKIVDFLLYVSDPINWNEWWDEDVNCPIGVMEWRGDPDITSQAAELLLDIRIP